MDLLLLVVLILGVSFVLRTKAQKQRIAMLAHYLRDYDIEKLMERLVAGYMRALDEKEPARQQQIWELQQPTENSLVSQFGSFAQALAAAPEPTNGASFRISTQAFTYPFSTVVEKLLGDKGSFDLRTAIRIHADGIAAVVANQEGRTPKERAFTLLAEMYLMQHTCHWYCKSKAVASARMQLRNQTTYEQVLQSVSPATRNAYLALIHAK
ncbi:MAG: hypothetical protein RSD57_05185 [Comamonas sp.]